MRRTLIMMRLFGFLVTGGAWAMGRLWWRGRRDPERARAMLLEVATRWSRRAVSIGGGRVEVIGAERIPAEGPVVYVANHQGVLDIPVLNGYLPGSPAFVAKKELFNIPVLGYWMRRIGCISLDRERPRVARDAIHAAAERVRAGRRMVLFPEGTRSRDPEGAMAPFRRGSMKLAVLAGATVVPVTVEGSRLLMSTATSGDRSGVVRVIVGDPVVVPELSDDAQRALPETLHEVIDRARREHHMGAIPGGEVSP